MLVVRRKYFDVLLFAYCKQYQKRGDNKYMTKYYIFHNSDKEFRTKTSFKEGKKGILIPMRYIVVI